MPTFDLPDVGEGLTEAEIISWKVEPGDEVAVNDVLVEIETAKSLVELPSPYAGTVTQLLVPEGETVAVGTPIVRVDAGTGADSMSSSPASSAGSASPAAAAASGGAAGERGAPGLPREPAREPVLVGYGPRPSRRRRRGASNDDAGLVALQGAFSTGHDVGVRVAPPEPPHPVSPVADAAAVELPAVGAFPEEGDVPTTDDGGPVRPLAKPPVRRLARDLGISLADVAPTGPGGTITRADVEAHGSRAAAPGRPRHERPGWDGLPREERVAVRSVRRAFTAPHVTQFLTVDVSGAMDLLDKLRSDSRFDDLRLSPLTLAARAMVQAARRTPEVNAFWDNDSGEIVVRRYVDLGVATTTPRGLVVPVVHDAHQLDIAGLAAAIADLALRAREGRTTPAETSGGTLSVTNIGVFGMDSGTPIIPPGQSAILALGQVVRRPWVVMEGGSESVVPRWVTTLALSFDHRLVDGVQASAFLADVAEALSDPALAWARG